jgi:hypothetical protein
MEKVDDATLGAEDTASPHDSFDWLGGLPFEVAKPEAILRFYRSGGFELRRFVTTEAGLR